MNKILISQCINCGGIKTRCPFKNYKGRVDPITKIYIIHIDKKSDESCDIFFDSF